MRQLRKFYIRLLAWITGKSIYDIYHERFGSIWIEEILERKGLKIKVRTYRDGVGVIDLTEWNKHEGKIDEKHFKSLEVDSGSLIFKDLIAMSASCGNPVYYQIPDDMLWYFYKRIRNKSFKDNLRKLCIKIKAFIVREHVIEIDSVCYKTLFIEKILKVEGLSLLVLTTEGVIGTVDLKSYFKHYSKVFSDKDINYVSIDDNELVFKNKPYHNNCNKVYYEAVPEEIVWFYFKPY